MPRTSTSRNNPFPIMERMTVKLVREYLAKKHSIIVPIGVIEQHGYHLPLKTDALIAEGIGRLIGERTGILVAPVIYSSFSGGGLPGIYAAESARRGGKLTRIYYPRESDQESTGQAVKPA